MSYTRRSRMGRRYGDEDAGWVLLLIVTGILILLAFGKDIGPEAAIRTAEEAGYHDVQVVDSRNLHGLFSVCRKRETLHELKAELDEEQVELVICCSMSSGCRIP